MSKPNRTVRAALVCGLFGLVGACASADPPPTVGTQPAPGMAAAADLWATSAAAFEGGVTGARFAIDRTQNEALRTYAERLADYYERTGQRFGTLMNRYSIDTTPGQGTRGLQEAQRTTTEALRSYEGEDFDRRWLDHQIATHRWMLDAIDRSYLPAARGRSELEAELRTLRGTLQQHLAEAERIRGTLR